MEEKTSSLNKSNEQIDEDWLRNFHIKVYDQFTLSRESLHNTHQWAITLTFGVITAIFTISNDQKYPNESGLVILLLTFPLMIRFFFRSCLEYSIQRKWQRIRNNLDQYFLNSDKKNKEILLKSIDTYYFDWRSPIPVFKIIIDNLKLAYLWPFLLYSLLIIWGCVSIKLSVLLINIIFLTGIMILIEIIGFFTYRGFKTE